MGVPAGLLLSTSVFAIVQAVTSEAAFVSWGCRVPSLASAVLVGVGLFIRLRLMESPDFRRVKDTRTEAPKPIVDVVDKYPREVLVAMGMRVAENGAFYILTVPFFGALSDRVGRRPLYLAGAVVPTLWAFPRFGLLNTESPVLIWLRSWSA
jgi:MHS family shikimate/dehydroshikimate transporter-like MFS transporter